MSRWNFSRGSQDVSWTWGAQPYQLVVQGQGELWWEIGDYIYIERVGFQKIKTTNSIKASRNMRAKRGPYNTPDFLFTATVHLTPGGLQPLSQETVTWKNLSVSRCDQILQPCDLSSLRSLTHVPSSPCIFGKRAMIMKTKQALIKTYTNDPQWKGSTYLLMEKILHKVYTRENLYILRITDNWSDWNIMPLCLNAIPSNGMDWIVSR